MLEIFTYGFMVRAITAGAIIAVIAPLIGNFLVVRRYSLMSDTLAHVALAGVAFGVLFEQNPLIYAVLATVLAGIGIDLLRQYRNIHGESVLAIFLSGSLAIAVVVMSAADSLNGDVLSFLFGSITTVTSTDLWIIGVLGIVVALLILGLYKELFLISLDEKLARANGLPVRILNLIFVILTALTVALSMRIVGALLIGALMVIPVVAATQARKSFRMTMLLSIVYSVLSVAGGLLLSYYYDLASGGMIVVCALGFFLLSLLLRRRS
jgi:zinc transport system permease protein